VANPQQQSRAAPDRRRDIETLAASIYARLAVECHGTRADALAEKSLAQAREFYRVCDQPKPPE
jgi:hypothetical protein